MKNLIVFVVRVFAGACVAGGMITLHILDFDKPVKEMGNDSEYGA